MSARRGDVLGQLDCTWFFYRFSKSYRTHLYVTPASQPPTGRQTGGSAGVHGHVPLLRDNPINIGNGQAVPDTHVWLFGRNAAPVHSALIVGFSQKTSPRRLDDEPGEGREVVPGQSGARSHYGMARYDQAACSICQSRLPRHNRPSHLTADVKTPGRRVGGRCGHSWFERVRLFGWFRTTHRLIRSKMPKHKHRERPPPFPISVSKAFYLVLT